MNNEINDIQEQLEELTITKSKFKIYFIKSQVILRKRIETQKKKKNKSEILKAVHKSRYLKRNQ